ncbi:MAG: SprT-like domain-containing protein [Butyrivibrio sp.]|nr:SprT-like domain-containing protein [Butyrivibrio sp.]
MGEEFKTENGKWDLEKIAKECEKDLKKIKIPIQKIISTHAVKDKYVFGRVEQRFYEETWFDLDISNSYRSTKYELAEVKTIICHLLLHTVKGCMNHGEKWMQYAEAADKAYGLHIIEHTVKPEVGRNWDNGSAMVTAELNNEICCYLDYLEKLEAVMRECSERLKSIGFNIGSVSGIDFSRDNSVFGRCWRNRDKSYTISISYKYANKDADGIGLRGLICHELLHTCKEDDSEPQTGVHGPRWREMARKVEKELGYKLMAESYSDAVRNTSGEPIMQYVCPVCGGYYDAYDDSEKRDAVKCKWCHHWMNAIGEGHKGILDMIYIWSGEFQDKLKIAGIPIGTLSGIGFVPEGRQTGFHDNWDKSYSIDLPGIYERQGILEDDGLKAYLCRELLRSCEGCGNYGDRWNEYLKKAEAILKIPPCQEDVPDFG